MKWRLSQSIVGLMLGAFALSGCGDDDVLPPDVYSPQVASAKVDRFQLAWENFARLAEYQPDETFKATVERLNQWSLDEPFIGGWQVDPLVRTLPPALIESSRLPLLKRLESSSFFTGDGEFLHEALLMREASRAIVGDEVDALKKAKLLFDWVIRNVQLDPSAMRLWPRENLLLGRAAPLDREWMFMMLARQQRLDVVWLAVPQGGDGTRFRLWCPALYEKGELYPFDLLWGTPVLSADGEGVATLAQAAADESLLTALDVPGKPYPTKAAELQKVAVLIAAREPFLSRRMSAVEQRLPEEERPVLTVEPSKMAEQLQQSKHVVSVRLWSWPYEYAEKLRHGEPAVEEVEHEVMRHMFPFHVDHVVKVEDKVLRADDGQNGDLLQQGYEARVWPLWAGRLHHLAGRFEPTTDDDTRLKMQTAAIPFYLIARAKLAELSDSVREQEATDQPLTEKDRQVLGRHKMIYAHLNKNATFWLGLIRYEQGDYATAADFLKRTLEIVGNGPAASPVRYNLGRTYEADQKFDEAIEQYRLERSPASMLRIRRLESRKKS